MLINYVSGNVDKRNSWDASLEICSSAESINNQVLLDKFYYYEDPYAAAFYYDYFTKDIDAADYIATINSELLRIQDSNYLGIRSYAEELMRAIEQNDKTILNSMKMLKSECNRKEFPWSD